MHFESSVSKVDGENRKAEEGKERERVVQKQTDRLDDVVEKQNRLAIHFLLLAAPSPVAPLILSLTRRSETGDARAGGGAGDGGHVEGFLFGGKKEEKRENEREEREEKEERSERSRARRFSFSFFGLSTSTSTKKTRPRPPPSSSHSPNLSPPTLSHTQKKKHTITN